MSRWFCMESDFWFDAKVRAAGATLLWPHIVAIMARNGWVCSDWELEPVFLAEMTQTTDAMAETAVAGLKRVGLLVEVPDGWSIPGHSQYQIREDDE